jgi:hypothetical protein
VYRYLGGNTNAYDTHVPEFTGAKLRMIRAWPVTESSPPNLAHLMGCAEVKLNALIRKIGKKHNTSGFFVEAVRQAVSEIGTESSWHTHGTQGNQDLGGFPDVGSHTQCHPPKTCWALVVAALRSLLVRTTAKACEHGLQTFCTRGTVVDLIVAQVCKCVPEECIF